MAITDETAVKTAESKKRVATRDESSESVKKPKKETKRIPNIAQELAKNRKHVKGTSPSPGIQSLSPPALVSSFKSETDTETDELVVQGTSGGLKMEQLRISSLLSPSIDSDRDLLSSKTQSVPRSPTQQPRQGSIPPKVILPTQKVGGNAFTKNESPDAPGVLVARISSPVNMPVTIPAEKVQGLSRKPSNAANPTTAPATTNTSVASTASKAVEKEKKSSSSTATPAKPKGNGKTAGEGRKTSKGGKKEATASTATKTGSEKGVANRTNSEKDNGAKHSSEKTSEKKETKKSAGKVADKKESSVSSKVTDSKKKTTTKKEQSASAKPVKTPKKLVAAPAIKSPSLLDVFERGKVTKEIEDPTIVVDIPLYSSKSNEYLDENGQVSFNFYKLVHDKFHAGGETNITDLKVAKRSLLSQLSTTSGAAGGVEEEEGEDIVEVDDEGDDDEEDEGEEEKIMASPKKKSHPNKGKSLIGKYDTEDPFIDDTELLWEEQRAATKDGFFVFFGPLIEKGHYASLERADGTMKRGGVKNK